MYLETLTMQGNMKLSKFVELNYKYVKFNKKYLKN